MWITLVIRAQTRRKLNNFKLCGYRNIFKTHFLQIYKINKSFSSIKTYNMERKIPWGSTMGMQVQGEKRTVQPFLCC